MVASRSFPVARKEPSRPDSTRESLFLETKDPFSCTFCIPSSPLYFSKKINQAKLLEIEKSAFRHAPPKLDFTCSHNRTWCFSNRDFSSSRSYFCSLPLSFLLARGNRRKASLDTAKREGRVGSSFLPLLSLSLPLSLSFFPICRVGRRGREGGRRERKDEIFAA